MVRKLRLINRLLSFFDKTPKSRFTTLEKKLKYKFNNQDLLIQAFTHRSISSKPRKNYERLEFLGDAVIDILVSEWLMEEYPEGDEGILTKKRSALVQKSFLGAMGNLLGLLKHMQVENTVDLSQSKIASKQEGNLFESLIGAMYLDGGIDPCRILVRKTIWAYRKEAWTTTNFKGQLIEFCHSRSLGNPRFQITSVSGPEHEKTFEIHVIVGTRKFIPGIGSNKKMAEQSAAQIALDVLTSEY